MKLSPGGFLFLAHGMNYIVVETDLETWIQNYTFRRSRNRTKLIKAIWS